MQPDTVRFAYDRSGWLTGRTGQMYDHDHYYYDKAGNLLKDEYQSAVMDNRLPGYGRDSYRYNEWGELTERREQQLAWNAQGQLTRVISSNSETRYQYDALGRRISKATYGRHTDQREQRRTTFVWEGFRLLQETTWQGKRTYLYDAEQPYTPVAGVTGRGESRKIWYYHTDLTGTVQEVTASDGTLVWAGYLAGFGENRGDISNSGAYFEQPLRLPGQYYDEETGLHYNLFRYYAPECGRFISQDPIGLLGGLNLYQYAPNPLSYIDPLGLTNLNSAQQQIDAVLREHLSAIQAIDPNATIGYRGSAASGISKAHDPSISRPIDFNNFDVDAYIKSDFLANDPAFTNRRRDAAEISGMKEIEASIDRKLRAIFPGLRAEPFGFRIFKTHELSDLARHGDTQHNVGCK